MSRQAEREDITIVVVGRLNPAIFQPQWFAKENLLPQGDMDEAVVEVVHSDITIFKTEDLSIRVDQNRFIASITQPPYITLADLVRRLFGEVLPHTPCKQLGINRHAHYRLNSEDNWHRLGRRLAPIEPWGRWAAELEDTQSNVLGGLSSLAMRQFVRRDGFTGHVQAQVAPSGLVKPNGVVIGVNDHYELEASAGEEPMQILQRALDNFDKSIHKAIFISDEVLKAERSK